MKVLIVLLTKKKKKHQHGLGLVEDLVFYMW